MISIYDEATVGALRDEGADFACRVAAAFAPFAEYPSTSPYDPHERYPEYPFGQIKKAAPNWSYATVRESLRLLGLDRENFGKSVWNPLGKFMRPGDCVLLKPNFIKEHRTDKQDEWIQIITHGSVIRAVADYVYLALKGKGRIVVADGPQTDSNFSEISRLIGLPELRAFYKLQSGFDLEVYDLRNELWIERDGVYVDRQRLRGDPAGTLLVDLAERSHFKRRKTNADFYGAFYDVKETNHHHTGGRHTYAFCQTPLLADVVVHIPKLKTHKKCGITVNLKGLVGLNGNKNLLPHYCFGSLRDGGDQFPDSSAKHRIENLLVTHSKKLMMTEGSLPLLLARKLKRHAYRFFGDTSDVVRSGNWHGNDTVWRMALDLNAILMFANKNGALQEKQQRRFFSVVDGIIAGEKNGPMEANAKPCGLVVAGASPVLVDAACARLMGFDHQKIPLISQALSCEEWQFAPCRYDEIELVSNRLGIDSDMLTDPTRVAFQFEPHFGWKHHIELDPQAAQCLTGTR